MTRHLRSEPTREHDTEELPESFVGVRVAPLPASGAVGAPTRNGHARVLARVIDLIVAVPNDARAELTVSLSTEDEDALRDADGRQLDANALAAAKGPREPWRVVLRDRFRWRYGLAVRFDAAKTRIE